MVPRGLTVDRTTIDYPATGFNKRKLEDRRRQTAEQKAAARRATERQILEDADHLITVWKERQVKRMPMLFSPTDFWIGSSASGLFVMRGNHECANIYWG